jgi:hypothetical protein
MIKDCTHTHTHTHIAVPNGCDTYSDRLSSTTTTAYQIPSLDNGRSGLKSLVDAQDKKQTLFGQLTGVLTECATAS